MRENILIGVSDTFFALLYLYNYLSLPVYAPLMAGIMELNCYVIGNSIHDIFIVTLPLSSSVSNLKDSIYSRRKARFDGTDADTLRLWKVSIALDDNFQQNVDPRNFEESDALLPVKRLSALFPQPPDSEHVHIVVGQSQQVSAIPITPVVSLAPVQKKSVLKVTNDAVLNDEQYEGVKHMWKNIDNVFANPGLGETPSNNLKSKYYRKYQESPIAILNGRYATYPNTTLAPPVELYHPVFAEFKAHLNNMALELPSDIVLNTVELMIATSEIKCREDQRINIRDIIAKLCALPITTVENRDRTLPDYVITVNRNSPPAEAALVAVFEEKSELGVNGDPAVQASFSYISYWADPSHQSFRTASCCPSFIIGVAGPWIAICGGVLTSHPIVQRLTDYVWLGHSRVIDEAYTFRVAKIFYSLRLAMHSLYDYHFQFKAPSIQNSRFRFFPSITSYQVGLQTVRFEYLTPLEPEDTHCVIFLARQLAPENTGGKLIVVKFVENYGEYAHRLLAANKLAPKLLYFGSINSPQEAVKYSYGNINMVVMEYIEGQTAQQIYGKAQIPPALRTVVQKAREHLSKASLVHGDLRRPNILIPKNGGVENALIIDFDWAGKAGKVRYPLHLSSAPGLWVNGVEPYGLIQAAHDAAMVDHL